MPLNNGNYIQEPKFSPDGSKVAFIVDNNLFYQDLTSGKITQITNDGKKNSIINGLGDWVYEEEFGHADYYQWNKAGDAIVFVRFDESKVPEIYIPIYGKSLYPKEMRYKYPKAGETNSTVTANLYQLNSAKTTVLNLGSFENYYIPQLWQTNGKDEIVLATSNRHHNHVDLLKVDTKSGNITKLLTETDNAWIETDNLTLEFLDDNSFLWASERDGYRQLYWYEKDGKLKKQVAKGQWEITDYYGYNPKTKEAYIQTTEKGSLKVVSKLNITPEKQL
jgi:dipeptidyl-peptidase-4